MIDTDKEFTYYSVEGFHLFEDRMVSQQHFHTLEEAIFIYDKIIKINSDIEDGVDVRVMEITLHDGSVKKTCVAQMIDEGKYFGSDEE